LRIFSELVREGLCLAERLGPTEYEAIRKWLEENRPESALTMLYNSHLKSSGFGSLPTCVTHGNRSGVVLAIRNRLVKHRFDGRVVGFGLPVEFPEVLILFEIER
jgi:hypothetical protein